MKTSILIFVAFLFFSISATAQTYELYEAGGSTAHVLRQPKQGVYLGQMLRQMGLKPNWTNRSWITEIHQVNPGRVDAKGEILAWDQPLVFPVSALKNLKGYSALEPKLVPVDLTVSEPVLAEPVLQEPLQDDTATAMAEEEPPAAPMEENRSSNSHRSTGYLLRGGVGAGLELLSADNNAARNTDLQTEFNFVGLFEFLLQFHEDHQVMAQFTAQYKTYSPPDNIGVAEDANFLMTLTYGYGYRLFNNFNVRLIGQSQQQNFATFPGNIIDLFTYWNHMVGLQIWTPLFDIGGSQISADLAGLYTLETSSDFDIDNGFQVKGGIYYEPQGLEQGLRLGAYAIFHNQLPSGYLTHQSTEAFGFVGYQF